jgi:Icc-related predicted phosphoesterase
MWNHVMRLVPMLLVNRVIYGKYLDIFVTHAPPWKIHDQEDLPHQGIKAFRWLLQIFKPRYHFHGHTHVYRPDAIIKTDFGDTQVINSYGYLETELQLGDLPAPVRPAES